MGTKFVNRTRQLVILELNSGATVHLAPGETSSSLESYETDNNRKLEKLLRSSAVQAVVENGAGAG